MSPPADHYDYERLYAGGGPRGGIRSQAPDSYDYPSVNAPDRSTEPPLAASAAKGRDARNLLFEIAQLGAARHHGRDLLAADVALGEEAHRAAAIEEHEVVADRISVVDVVGDQDHREAVGARLRDVAQHERRLLDAERRGRLVEDQHAGAEIDGAGDREALPLAARKRADRLMRIADMDADLVHFFAVDGVRRAPVEALPGPPAAHRLAAHEEVPHDRHQRNGGEVLVDRGDAEIERVARARKMHRPAVEEDLAGIGRMDAGEDLDQRRLAGAVVAEEAADLAAAAP